MQVDHRRVHVRVPRPPLNRNQWDALRRTPAPEGVSELVEGRGWYVRLLAANDVAAYVGTRQGA